jgi:ribosomal protein L22
MVEETKATEKKPRAKKAEVKTEEVKVAEAPKVDEKVAAAPEEKKVEAKRIEVKKAAKDIAIVNAYSVSISTKHSSAICKMIMTRPIDGSIEMLNLVLQEKLAVPMAALEIPHRKRSLMPKGFGGGGRFPRNAAREFILLLKQLKANCETNGVENPVVTIAMANIASRPFKKEGRRAKSTHIHLEARDKTKLIAKRK